MVPGRPGKSREGPGTFRGQDLETLKVPWSCGPGTKKVQKSRDLKIGKVPGQWKPYTLCLFMFAKGLLFFIKGHSTTGSNSLWSCTCIFIKLSFQKTFVINPRLKLRSFEFLESRSCTRIRQIYLSKLSIHGQQKGLKRLEKAWKIFLF